MIRRGERRDAEALARCRQALWTDEDPAESRAEARSLLSGPGPGLLPAAIFVAEVDGEVVGFSEVSLRSFVDGCEIGRPVGYLEGWYVTEEHRQTGLGRALVEAGEAWCREQGCREMGSDTWADNEVSLRAHEKLGFEVVDHCVNFRKSIARGGPDPDRFYGPELAALHHTHFGDLARAAAGELLERLAAAGLTDGRIADLAMGSGLAGRRLIDAGFDVVGVDLSRTMLRLAEKTVSGAVRIHGSLWDMSLPGPLVAVLAVGEAFSYANDPAAGLAGLRNRLHSIYEVLVPGGVLVFDVAGPGRAGSTGRRESIFDRGGTYLRMVEREDPATATLTRDLTIFQPLGKLHRRTDEPHRLVLHAPQQVETLLTETGFTAQRLARYGDVELAGGVHGFAACKSPRGAIQPARTRG